MTSLSVCLLIVSWLAVFKAPAKPLWYVAIAATEWGHWLALLSFTLALGSRFLTRRSSAAFWTALAAGVIYLTPLARATRIAGQLPSQLSAVFGQVVPREGIKSPARSRPLAIADLFGGVDSASVQVSSRVYATVEGQALSLDLYRSRALDQPLPGVIVIHGGSWQSGARGEFPDLDRYLAARGYIVASIDYRLAPSSVFPAPRDDVFTAIAYLKAHAKEIGWDKEHLVLLGRSAGGQIALSAAYAGKEPAIKGVIALYAPNDLVWAYAFPANPLIMNSRKVIETYLGGPPARAPGIYERASPLREVNEQTVPTLMIHGARDELVSVLHDERLSRRLKELRRVFMYLRLPWATHGCDANFSGPSGQLSTFAIERFLAFVLPSSQEERLAKRRLRRLKYA